MILIWEQNSKIIVHKQEIFSCGEKDLIKKQ